MKAFLEEPFKKYTKLYSIIINNEIHFLLKE